MTYQVKARVKTTTETSYVYFMKMIYMHIYIDLSEKDILVQKGSILSNFLSWPRSTIWSSYGNSYVLGRVT